MSHVPILSIVMIYLKTPNFLESKNNETNQKLSNRRVLATATVYSCYTEHDHIFM